MGGARLVGILAVLAGSQNWLGLFALKELVLLLQAHHPAPWVPPYGSNDLLGMPDLLL